MVNAGAKRRSCPLDLEKLDMHRLAARSLMAVAVLAASSLAHANLVINGGFEASSSPTTTPTGWTNIGHSDGVIAYAAFGTPVYEGRNFYDLGGFGDAFGPIGDGIAQTFATTIGATYNVTFGLSSENLSGTETLTASAAGTSVNYVLSPTADGTFQRPFSTETFSFVATGASTTLSFVHTAGAGGNNDPMIDGVIVDLAGGGTVPEPESYGLVLAALAGLTLARRRKGN